MVVNGEKSESIQVRSGVPQGTVIGPVLFIIMVSDIGVSLVNKMSMYADDTRLFGQVKNEDDAKQMQEDLNRIYAWAEKNNMEFNSKKI